MAVTEIASLEQVKNYLQIPDADTTYDNILTTIFMPAATDVIEREIGHVVAKNMVEFRDGGFPQLFLYDFPVLYIQSVQEGWGYYNWELDNQEVNTQPALSLWSYSLDRPKDGLLTRRGPGNVLVPFVSGVSNIRIAYVVGRETMPPNVLLVFLELIAYWFQASQLRTTNQASAAFNASADDFTRSSGITTTTAGFPQATLALLKGNRRRPIIG